MSPRRTEKVFAAISANPFVVSSDPYAIFPDYPASRPFSVRFGCRLLFR